MVQWLIRHPVAITEGLVGSTGVPHDNDDGRLPRARSVRPTVTKQVGLIDGIHRDEAGVGAGMPGQARAVTFSPCAFSLIRRRRTM